MSIRETDPKYVGVNSVWKHVYLDRPDPARADHNRDFIVSRVTGDTVFFGTSGTHRGNWDYRFSKFLADLVPIRDPDIKLKTSLHSVLGAISVCPGLQEEVQAMLVELDI